MENGRMSGPLSTALRGVIPSIYTINTAPLNSFGATYTLGVNPFNQPGVEAYKKNMFALLEKPGFEEATKAIKARL